MKWNKSLLKFVPVIVCLFGISIAIIYCFEQNSKASESEEALKKMKNEQEYLGSIPEIKNNELLHWNIKGLKQHKRFVDLRNKVIEHYDLNKKYKNDKYTDVFIYNGYLVVSDKKYQQKINDSDEYDLYAVEMEYKRKYEKLRYFNFIEEPVGQTYEKLF